MEKYLRMSNIFEGEVVSEFDCLTDYSGEPFGEVECKYAAHAINTHDELVAMNKELLEVIERVIGSSKEFDKVMGTSEWADGYKQRAIDTGEALRGIIDNIKAKAAS